MFWIGFLTGTLAVALLVFLYFKTRGFWGLLPRGGLTPWFVFPTGSTRYDCATQKITGEIQGSSPWPEVIFGYAWPSTTADPSLTRPHQNSGHVLWLNKSTGGFEISAPSGTTWPNSGTVRFCVWGVQMGSSDGTFQKVCNGSGSGGGGGLNVSGAAMQQVHDKSAAAYAVHAVGFLGGQLESLNSTFGVTMQRTSDHSLCWQNGGDAQETPHVALSIESIVDSDVICTLKQGDALLEYALSAKEWRPLSENRLFLVGGTGIDDKTPLPDQITVVPV